MIIESNYELNISRNGIHHCMVELGNVPLSTARIIAEPFKEKFPESDGFKVTLRRIECGAQEMEI